MIRKMTSEDIEAVGQIWLAASIKAHNFVPADFWRSKLETMTTEILPHPDTEGYVYEDAGVIDGFVSLCGNSVGGLFVAPERQRSGIGSALLDYIKERHSLLTLNVYRKNVMAARFYETQGFEIVGESTCQHTGCGELQLKWERSPEPAHAAD